MGIVVLVLLFSGCGKTVPMSGKVLFSDDKAPLTRGRVVFESATLMSSGSINSDGSYTLGSFEKDDGIVPGTYKVYVDQVAAPPKQMERPKTGGAMPRPVYRPERVVDPKFTSLNTTPLSVEVQRGTKTYDVIVDR